VTPPNNLPAQLTSFIGREQQLEIASSRLQRSDVRLLTLIGPGGCGKTRLGLQIANALVEHFTDGTYYVPLAPIADPDLVAAAIAQVLTLRESESRPLRDVVRAYLHDRQMLLLLDNFEQVVGAAPQIAELLQTCPRLKVLVTSRAPLRISGEHELAVPPLALPGLTARPIIDELMRCEAVRLFVERAQAVRADFALTTENGPVVAEICRCLDGLPLAIELAAARTKLLSPAMILTRLTDRFALLTGGPSDLPARQRTLRDTIGWSYDLLSDRERALFRRLGVFRGGWTLEAAEWVSGVIPPTSVLDVIGSLVDKCLVRRGEGAHGDTRFTMLETILAFSRAQLAECDEGLEARRRHAAYFVELAEEAEPALRGPEEAVWLDRLESEIDNLRAALEWLLGRPEDREAAVRLAGALGGFWGVRGYWTEGRSWLTRALAKNAETPPSRTPARVRALCSAAFLAHVQGDQLTARALLEEAQTIARKLADDRGLAWATHLLGRVEYFLGDYPAAAVLGQEALALARAVGDRWVESWCLQLLARAAHLQGNFKEARALYGESLLIRQELGDREGTGYLFGLIGMLAFDEGKNAEAQALFAQALTISRELGYGWPIAQDIGGLAAIAARAGHPERAVCLGAAATRWLRLLAVRMMPDLKVALDAALEQARRELGEVAYAAAWAEGQAMTTEQAVECSLAEPVSPRHEAADTPLSSREREVAALIARGRTNRQIADELVISVRTADHHVANILTKLDLTTRAQIAGWAVQHGLSPATRIGK
jgi:non-specific serine/threonine protein kinase